MTDTIQKQDVLDCVTEIVSSYLSNNVVPSADIPTIIRNVFMALSDLDQVAQQKSAAAERPQPAVPISKSIQPDYIVCLEDGKKMKMLKKHLRSSYDMSPEEYRERWGLPSTYPMVCPNYAKRRSELAKDIGLGVKGRAARKTATNSVARPAKPISKK